MSNLTNDKTYALFSNPAGKKIVSEIEKRGSKIFEFPAVKIEPIISSANSAEILRDLTAFDWIIFPDVLTVDYFLQILEGRRIDFFELDTLRVCAFGEAVSDRLRFSQLHADIVPSLLETESVFSSLLDYLSGKKLSGLKFLLTKEIAHESEIGEKLKNNGAVITEMAVYKAEKLNKIDTAKFKTLITGGAIDEFVFGAAEDLISLRHYLQNEITTSFFTETRVSATDENVLQSLNESGLKPIYFSIKRG